MVGIGASTLEGLFRHLELPPVSNTLLEYLRHLQDSVDRVQLIADFARGKAGDYLSATEVANLVNYSETTIGRIRKRMDATLGRVAQLYLHALRSELKGGIDIDVDGETVTLNKKDLELRWRVQVVDTASTPAAAAQKMADLAAAQGNLIDLATLIEQGGVPGKMAEEILTLLVGLMDLPPSMLPASLKAAVEPPPEAEVQPLSPVIEAPPPEALPPGAGLQPGDIANSPEGQAIMAQAELEQQGML
jgi:hypothetical protein